MNKVRFDFKMPEWLYKKLRAEAYSDGVSMAELIRQKLEATYKKGDK